MFERYIACPFECYHPLHTPDTPLPPPPGKEHSAPMPDLGSIKNVLSHFKLTDIQSGDLLLLGLFVFLLNKKADEELLIALGLLLIL